MTKEEYQQRLADIEALKKRLDSRLSRLWNEKQELQREYIETNQPMAGDQFVQTIW